VSEIEKWTTKPEFYLLEALLYLVVLLVGNPNQPTLLTKHVKHDHIVVNV